MIENFCILEFSLKSQPKRVHDLHFNCWSFFPMHPTIPFEWYVRQQTMMTTTAYCQHVLIFLLYYFSSFDFVKNCSRHSMLFSYVAVVRSTVVVFSLSLHLFFLLQLLCCFVFGCQFSFFDCTDLNLLCLWIIGIPCDAYYHKYLWTNTHTHKKESIWNLR